VKNTIVVEGTVGCGKTTLAKFLSEKTQIKLFEEAGIDHLIAFPFTKEFSNLRIKPASYRQQNEII